MLSKEVKFRILTARSFPMADKNRKNYLRAFWDFFVLFSGISTASNLTRTQSRPVRYRGMFLFRTPANEPLKPRADSR
jgi:hypothetical protein